MINVDLLASAKLSHEKSFFSSVEVLQNVYQILFIIFVISILYLMFLTTWKIRIVPPTFDGTILMKLELSIVHFHSTLNDLKVKKNSTHIFHLPSSVPALVLNCGGKEPYHFALSLIIRVYQILSLSLGKRNCHIWFIVHFVLKFHFICFCIIYLVYYNWMNSKIIIIGWTL